MVPCRRLEHLWVDDSEAPLYRLTYPVACSDHDLAQLNATAAEFYRQLDHAVAFLVDLSAVTHVPARQRKMISEHFREIRPYAKDFNAGNGVFVSSMVARGILTAVNWVTPPPFPQRIFGRKRDAETWVRDQLCVAFQRRSAG